MIFREACRELHPENDFAGVNDLNTWACPFCHIVFKHAPKRKNLNGSRTHTADRVPR